MITKEQEVAVHFHVLAFFIHGAYIHALTTCNEFDLVEGALVLLGVGDVKLVNGNEQLVR